MGWCLLGFGRILGWGENHQWYKILGWLVALGLGDRFVRGGGLGFWRKRISELFVWLFGRGLIGLGRLCCLGRGCRARWGRRCLGGGILGAGTRKGCCRKARFFGVWTGGRSRWCLGYGGLFWRQGVGGCGMRRVWLLTVVGCGKFEDIFEVVAQKTVDV